MISYQISKQIVIFCLILVNSVLGLSHIGTSPPSLKKRVETISAKGLYNNYCPMLLFILNIISAFNSILEKFMPPKLTLPDDIKNLLNVEKIHNTFDGGQKYVFIVTCKGKKCAVKMFRAGFGEREKRELDFYQKNSCNTGIPNILDVIDYKGETIVVEDFVEGDNLQDAAGDYYGNYEKISKLIFALSDIMEPFWKGRIVHRDLKPLNIIIKKDGSPVVLDFGIFKDPDLSTITDTGFQPHSWNFASPEQLLGEKENISYRSDFFSLGVIAYYLYYKKLPFGGSKDEVLKTIEKSPFQYHSDTDCKLNTFFNSVFLKNPSERPRNVELMKECIKK